MEKIMTIGFIGAGKMATALAKGFINFKICSQSEILASDVAESARRAFEKETGARTTDSNEEVARFGNVLILAVKPQNIEGVLNQVKQGVTEEHLVISIAAGIKTSFIEGLLPEGTRVVRVMPNTPALVGCGASAYAPGKFATQQDVETAHKLFSSVGLAVKVSEELLDAVTGLSGSGPAYVYLVIEAMSDGGVAAGLPRDVATRLAAATVMGAAKMVVDTGLHPGVLKDMVTSPGGTTIEGLHELEKSGVRAAFINAVRAASEKSKLLSKGGLKS